MILALLFILQVVCAQATISTFTTSYAPSPSLNSISTTNILQPLLLHQKNGNWREPASVSTAANCMPLTISSGLIILNYGRTIISILPASSATTQATSSSISSSLSSASSVSSSSLFSSASSSLASSSSASSPSSSYNFVYANTVTYTPLCPDGQTIILNGKKAANKTNIIEYELGTDDTSDSTPFSKSVITTCLVLSASLVLVYFTLVLLLSQYYKRPVYQLFTVAITAATITMVMVKVNNHLYAQLVNGYFDSTQLSEFLGTNMTINIMFAITLFFLTMAQVQVLFSIFKRRREKVIIFWFGMILSICQAILWALAAIYGDSQSNSDDGELSGSEDAVIVFAYLFKIAISIMYAGCILYFAIMKRKIAFGSEVILLAVMSHASTITPVVLFILDTTATFVDEWSDFVDLVVLMASSIVVWEWIDRVHEIERKIQQNSVLGKQYFQEDEKSKPCGGTNGSIDSGSINQNICSIRVDTNSPDFHELHQNSNSSTLVSGIPLSTDPSIHQPDHPLFLYSNFKMIFNWLKFPIPRPETSSSACTTYTPVVPPKPIPPAVIKRQLPSLSPAYSASSLPKFHYDLKRGKPS